MNDSRKISEPNDETELNRAHHLVAKIDPSNGTATGEIVALSARLDFIKHARRELAARRRRVDIFGNTMFGEAGWEVLLLLYGNHSARQTIAGINQSITTAPTTTLRWLDHLESQDLIRREPHPTDARAVLIMLTEKAVKRLDQYFSETLKFDK